MERAGGSQATDTVERAVGITPAASMHPPLTGVVVHPASLMHGVHKDPITLNPTRMYTSHVCDLGSILPQFMQSTSGSTVSAVGSTSCTLVVSHSRLPSGCAYHSKAGGTVGR